MILQSSRWAPVHRAKTSKTLYGAVNFFNFYLELFKNKFKNLIRTSKFKFSFQGLILCQLLMTLHQMQAGKFVWFCRIQRYKIMLNVSNINLDLKTLCDLFTLNLNITNQIAFAMIDLFALIHSISSQIGFRQWVTELYKVDLDSDSEWPNCTKSTWIQTVSDRIALSWLGFRKWVIYLH